MIKPCPQGWYEGTVYEYVVLNLHAITFFHIDHILADTITNVLYKVECCEPPELEMHTPCIDNSYKLKLNRDQSVKVASKHQ